MRRAFAIAALATGLAGGEAAAVQAPAPAPVAAPVQAPVQAQAPRAACRGDHVHGVIGDGLCLPLRSFAPRRVPRNPVLVVFLHGNTGGPDVPVGDDLASYAADIARQPGTVAVTLTRPGHTGTDGRVADGPFRPQLLPDSPDIPAVAEAIAALKRHYHARRVVVVGFSGGSRLIARMVQLQLGTFDGALLYACPCEDPAAEIAGTIPAGARAYPRPIHLTLITGTTDYGTRGGPDFARVLRARHVDATFRPLRGIGHVFDDHVWSTTLKPALLRLTRH